MNTNSPGTPLRYNTSESIFLLTSEDKFLNFIPENKSSYINVTFERVDCPGLLGDTWLEYSSNERKGNYGAANFNKFTPPTNLTITIWHLNANMADNQLIYLQHWRENCYSLQMILCCIHAFISITHALPLLNPSYFFAECKCNFPKDWKGRWFQSGLGEVIIRKNVINQKGACYEHHRDYFLLESK